MNQVSKAEQVLSSPSDENMQALRTELTALRDLVKSHFDKRGIALSLTAECKAEWTGYGDCGGMEDYTYTDDMFPPEIGVQASDEIRSAWEDFAEKAFYAHPFADGLEINDGGQGTIRWTPHDGRVVIEAEANHEQMCEPEMATLTESEVAQITRQRDPVNPDKEPPPSMICTQIIPMIDAWAENRPWQLCALGEGAGDEGTIDQIDIILDGEEINKDELPQGTRNLLDSLELSNEMSSLADAGPPVDWINNEGGRCEIMLNINADSDTPFAEVFIAHREALTEPHFRYELQCEPLIATLTPKTGGVYRTIAP